MMLDTDLLLKAYAIGVFPMADSRDDPDVFWVEPQLRAIFPLDRFHLSRSLAKKLRQDRFEFTCNAAFAKVIAACAETSSVAATKDRAETWINHEIEAAYIKLNQQGNAHSIECWQDGELVGGLYGVSIGRAFCGESMFSCVTDASKAALAALVAAMRMAGYELLDCQFMTGHLASLGAREISQGEYLRLLAKALYGVDASGNSRAVQPSGSAVSDGSAGVSSAGAGGAGLLEPVLPLPDALSALLEGAAAEGALSDAGRDLAGFGRPSSPGKRIAQSLTQTS
ncbi:leucyl/phenylalanyl-tRNA--protein transferase [Sphingorhabdus sp. Alg239-R122]|uniref:leucyl/phenylalanyl-tRNA--protein transferase n=1 Tax=Sphingorhabdus sp. Alg239-R122 TaxID=2305989 RepID=UPI0013DD136C|nr:leucyl/phenylalanyl-tRNA--protein transferase [Sphingorhabdus sp. Alg239-R122]